MMSSGLTKFKDVIQDHKIFQELDTDVGDKLDSGKPDQLMHIHDDSLYVWNNKVSCLNAVSLSLILEEKTADVQVISFSFVIHS